MQLEIFRAGKHTSADGRIFEFTREDLDEIVDTYDPATYRAPLILTAGNDHQVKGDDASQAFKPLCHGVPENLKRVGDSLLAEFDKITPDFEQWLKDKRIPGISSSFYLPQSPNNPYPGKKALRHIASVLFPSVKGMALPGFSEMIERGAIEFELPTEDESVEFPIEYGAADLIGVLRRMRDYLIEQDGLEIADRVIPSEKLGDLTENIAHEELVSKEVIDTLTAHVSRLESDIVRLQLELQRSQETQEYQESTLQYGEVFGSWLDRVRRERGVSVPVLARRSGLSESGVRLILSGETTRPTEEAIESLASALEMPAQLFKNILMESVSMSENMPENLSTNVQTTEELQQLREQLRQVEAKNAELAERNAKFEEQIETERKAARQRDIANLCERRQTENRFTPAMVRPVSADFSEGAPNNLKDFLTGLTPEQFAFFSEWSATIPVDRSKDALFNEYTSEDYSPDTDPLAEAYAKARESYSQAWNS